MLFVLASSIRRSTIYRNVRMTEKIIIYQLLPRLFGNRVESPVFNGSKEQNGCGRMNDLTMLALRKIKAMGVTHIWPTGLIEHSTQTDYSDYGIPRDHSAMVKGRAGSPYAIKDYYNIDPDLAIRPDKRMAEFESMLARIHKAGMKMVMDFVPNHVSRQYCGELGLNDNPQQAFSPQNNFYYIPGQRLACRFDMTGIEKEPYYEMPAKATGNDCFSAQPDCNDWYETIKLNYGVDYCAGGVKHFTPVPDTWHRMLHILRFWAGKGVDAFRCDMAEMVPVEFWDWALRQVKDEFPQVQFIGEVYNPGLYREYIYRGHFDYLYDKVGLYDCLRGVIRMERSASEITCYWQQVDDIRTHMLYFLENHDEQRLASDFFAGDAQKGIPALAVEVLMGGNPFMLYFGQEFGERGMEREGFSGVDGRTTIFDYWRVPSVQQWWAGGKCCSKHIDAEARNLYTQYKKILRLAASDEVFSTGKFYDLMYVNYDNALMDANRVYAFMRSGNGSHWLVVCNFSNYEGEVGVRIPQHALDFMQIAPATYQAHDYMSGRRCELTMSAQDPAVVKVGAWSAAIINIQP
ncbi:MAG: alpha-amylase [Bacteroidaceae bacterium]|nr:alpha-amylase [Bacteroidaceae bacterium]